ncbi:MAG: hypothetical protein ACTSWP_02305 [Candidatus Freyarchaeota archaeon]
MVVELAFFPIFEVHEELSKLVKGPFKGFVLLSEAGLLVDTSFEDEEETNTAIMVANWLRVAVDRVQSELGVEENYVSIMLSLGGVSYLFRQLGRDFYVTFVLEDGATALGREEELVFKKVEMLLEGKQPSEVEVSLVETTPPPVIAGRSVDPFESVDRALSMLKDAMKKIESELAAASTIKEINTLVDEVRLLEKSISDFKQVLENLENQSQEVVKLGELVSCLVNTLQSIKDYSEKLSELFDNVKKKIYAAPSTMMEPASVEVQMENLRSKLEEAATPEEGAEALTQAINSLVKRLGYLHPALYEMRSYYRLFKEASQEEYETLKKEFLDSMKKWKGRLLAAERVLSS